MEQLDNISLSTWSSLWKYIGIQSHSKYGYYYINAAFKAEDIRDWLLNMVGMSRIRPPLFGESKEDYYIRPGVYIDAVQQTIHDYYGHFHTEIRSDTLSQIFRDTELFFQEWTDKALIRDRVLAFMEWDKRNPLDKRRAGEVDYETDPVPAPLFGIQPYVFQYVIENF